MIVNFSPVRSDEVNPEYRYGDKKITVNGVLFDFSQMKDGDYLHPTAIESPWFTDLVRLREGQLEITLLVFHGPNPTQAEAFPVSLNPAPVITLEPTAEGFINFSRLGNSFEDDQRDMSRRIDQERDRRIAEGFAFEGKAYDSDARALDNIATAYPIAGMAVVDGAVPGNLRWADESQDFRWIAEDNTYMTMDAQTVMAFGQAAAAWKTKHIYAARELKSMSPIPIDYTDDKYWS